VFVSIGIYIGFVEIDLFTLEETFSKVILKKSFKPDLGEPCATFDSISGILVLNNADFDPIDCTSLSGNRGNEELECICGPPDTETILSFTSVSTVILGSPKKFDLTLRGFQGEVDLGNAPISFDLDFVSYGNTILAENLIDISQELVLAGLFELNSTEMTGNREIFLPEPERPLLTTVFNAACDKKWTLTGHTNVIVRADEVLTGCDIFASGGDSTNAKLIIDFGSEKNATTRDCNDGNRVTIMKVGDSLTMQVMRQDDDEEPTEFNIHAGSRFTDVEIFMTRCEDEVEIISTLGGDTSGSILVELFEGDDLIKIGSNDSGLDSIYKSIVVKGGLGNDTLTVDDSGSSANKDRGVLNSGSILNLLPPAIEPTASNNTIDYSGFENITLSLTSGESNFTIENTAPNSYTVLEAGASEDTIYVFETLGELVVHGNEGDDTFYVSGIGGNTKAVVFGNGGDDFLFVNGTRQPFSSSIKGPVNGLDRSVLRWSGGDGNDVLRAVFVSSGTFLLDVFDDTVGTNNITVDCGTRACSVLNRENFIANDQLDVFEKINMNRHIETENITELDQDPADELTFIDTARVNNVLVRLNDGENRIHFDDTFAPVTVFGGPERNGKCILVSPSLPLRLLCLTGLCDSEFYVGQFFANPRDADANMTALDPVTAAPASNGFPGFASVGNTHPITVNGGSDNDLFEIVRNVAPVVVVPKGNETKVLLRSLIDTNGTKEENKVSKSSKGSKSRGCSSKTKGSTRRTRNRRKTSGKGSTNQKESEDEEQVFPQYVINSIVDVAGEGFPFITIVGSDSDDSFVVTNTEVRGGGLAVKFSGAGRLQIDAGPGINDSVTVLSTDVSLLTELYQVEGYLPTPRAVSSVVSRNTYGHMAVIEHQVSSHGTEYNGIFVEGITTNVFDDDDVGYINVVEEDSIHVVTEDGEGSFFLTVFPVISPNGTVVLEFQTPLDMNGSPYFLLNETGAEFSLSFTGIGPQRVFVEYNPNASPLPSGDAVFFITSAVRADKTDDKRFASAGQSIASIRIILVPSRMDTEAIAVTVVEPTGVTSIAEGTDGFESTYNIYLRPCNDQFADEVAVFIVPSAPHQVVLSNSIITGELWNVEEGCKTTVSVAAFPDALKEGQHFITLSHFVRNVTISEFSEAPSAAPTDSISSKGSSNKEGYRKSSKGSNGYSQKAKGSKGVECECELVLPGTEIFRPDGSLVLASDVTVRIYDNDTAGFIVQASLRGISTIENVANFTVEDFVVPQNDFYFVRLTQQPTSSVELAIEVVPTATFPLTDPNTESTKSIQITPVVDDEGTGSPSNVLVFTTENWAEWQAVYIEPVDDDLAEGVDLFLYAPQPIYGVDPNENESSSKGKGQKKSDMANTGKSFFVFARR